MESPAPPLISLRWVDGRVPVAFSRTLFVGTGMACGVFVTFPAERVEVFSFTRLIHVDDPCDHGDGQGML